MEEGYYNKIEYYEDSIKSLLSAKKLLDINFTNKIADYTRFIMSKKEREKVKSSKILQEIINYRKELDHINTRIKKIELEKSNTIKWIYFQMQVKEKKLVLPNYYKVIIENWSVENWPPKRNPTRLMTRREKEKTRKRSFRRVSYYPHDSYAFSSKESSNIKINNNLNNNTSSNNSLYKKEEYEKVIYYKTNLIFKTPEEFQDRLKYFDSHLFCICA